MYRSKADKAVCGGCKHDFMRHPDCAKCELDARANEVQAEWLEGDRVQFIGLNLTSAFEHPMRAAVLAAFRGRHAKAPPTHRSPTRL